MWVFPGGRVDPPDYLPDRPDDIDAAVRRAAVREAREETGLVLDPATLVPFSHWMPPANAPKRFATWFFIAPTPEGQVVIDEGEIQDHDWARPTDVLDRVDRREVEMAPPTWVSLHRLAELPDVEAAISEASTRPRWSTSRPASAPSKAGSPHCGTAMPATSQATPTRRAPVTGS